MNLRRTDLEYLIKLQDKIDRGETIVRRTDHENEIIEQMPINECSECGDIITDIWDRDHIILGDYKNPILAICCEGYHPLNAS